LICQYKYFICQKRAVRDNFAGPGRFFEFCIWEKPITGYYTDNLDSFEKMNQGCLRCKTIV